MRRYLRKGISPLIATVLLILIAIATGLLIYAFATGWIGSRTALGAGPSSSIAIDAAYISYNESASSKCNVTVYVRNVGSVPTNITAIYVTEVATSNVYAVTKLSEHSLKNGLNAKVDPGQVIELAIDFTDTGLKPKSGYSYEIKVVTADGATAATTVTYRG